MTDSAAGPHAASEADRAVTVLYREQYGPMVRLATLLLGDQGRAEEVVQDAFVELHGRWARLHDQQRAAGYLRRSVVNGCRSAQRRRGVEMRHAPSPPDDATSAEASVLAAADRDRVFRALGELSPRQREVLVLRYYLDLSEADIADALRISRGAVKSHSSRGIDALRTRLAAQNA